MLVLVLVESVMIALLGSILGLAVAGFIIPGLPASTPFLGGTTLPEVVVMQGIAVAVLLGIAVGLPPAIRAMKLSIVDALGEHA